MEPKPAPAAGHRLAGLFQEVEKLTADTKLAEHKAEPKVAESRIADPRVADARVVESRAAESRVADPKVADPQFKEQKADPKLAEQKIVEVKPEEPTLAPLTEPDPMVTVTPPAGPEEVVAESQRPKPPVQPAPAAELRPLNMSAVVLEPRPTVAELAAKLAPDPVVPTPDEPRPVDRIRRDSSTTSLPDSGRKKAVRLTVNRLARPVSIGVWRGIAAALLLVSIALGGLIASWRYIPERLPAGLRPTAVLNLSEVTSSLSKRPVRIEAQFDE